jgi:hypothetical protein
MGGTSSPVSVAYELGLGLTSTISMNDAAVRTLAGVSGSGTSWSMSSLYGKSNSYSVEYLVVAGGGGGGNSASYGGSSAQVCGGGGAGGYLASTATVSGAYTITVGSGGASITTAAGTDSSFGAVATSTGGGRGASYTVGSSTGGSGGGGGIYAGNTGSAGTSGQGYAGRNASSNIGCCGGGYYGGGGGGASGQGPGYPPGFNIYTRGGDGLQWSNGTYYAGGGQGGAAGDNGYVYYTQYAPAALGGGAKGSWNMNGTSPYYATSATVNTGGGGGGAAYTYVGFGGNDNIPGTNGASGIVIIRYAGAQRGTGGTVTSAGGYTYHTFTSSGTFTA